MESKVLYIIGIALLLIAGVMIISEHSSKNTADATKVEGTVNNTNEIHKQNSVKPVIEQEPEIDFVEEEDVPEEEDVTATATIESTGRYFVYYDGKGIGCEFEVTWSGGDTILVSSPDGRVTPNEEGRKGWYTVWIKNKESRDSANVVVHIFKGNRLKKVFYKNLTIKR